MNGLLGGLPPGLRGYQAQRQFDMQEQNQQLGQATGLLNMRNAVAQQQQQQKDMEFKGLLGEKLRMGDMEGAKGLMMQYKPELFAKSLVPQQPKWQVSERFNPQTGRAEKVIVDMNDPSKVQPFGGQKAPTMSFGPDGVARDMSAVAPGTVAQDPGKLITIGPDGRPMVNPLALQAKSMVAAAGAPRVSVSTGMKKTDENFAKDFIEFATGGFADTQKQLQQLKDVSTALGQKGANLTGPILGNTPRTIRNVVAPESVATQESVEEVVQRNLRLVLGAQFTEKEGERLISRAYNPALSEAENKKRVDRLITQIQSAAEAKLDASRYFMANGTLEGWKGKVWTMSDFNPDSDATPKRRASDGQPVRRFNPETGRIE